MKRKSLILLFLSVCSATLLAQSSLEGGLSLSDSSLAPNSQLLTFQPGAIGSLSGAPIFIGSGSADGFNPALVPDSYIHLNGSGVSVDSWTNPAPEPGPVFTAVLGALLAWQLGRRRANPARQPFPRL